MHSVTHLFIPTRTIKLGNDYRGAGGKACEKTHQKVDQRSGAASYRRKRFLAHKISHNHRIDGIIQLLKKGS